nr:MAG TPA: hypothetical protein [Caudoviricetes sp.]
MIQLQFLQKQQKTDRRIMHMHHSPFLIGIFILKHTHHEISSLLVPHILRIVRVGLIFTWLQFIKIKSSSGKIYTK